MNRSVRVLLTAVFTLATVMVTSMPASAASLSDIGVTVTRSAETVLPGETVIFTVTLTNHGPAVPPTTTLTDTSTGGGKYVAASSQLPSGCDAPANGTVNPVISCTFNFVGAGQSRQLKVALETTDTPGTQTNSANASVPPNELGIFDDNTGNDNASASIEVAFRADTSIAVAGPAVALIDETITYEVTASNAGPSATDVSITDGSSGGGAFVADASSIPEECTAPADGTIDPTITCTASLASGASLNFTVGIRAIPGTQSNSATVTNTTANDPDTSNNAASASTLVSAAADLGVSVVSTPVEVSPVGHGVLYKVVVTNDGPSDATALVTDTSTGGGTYDAASSDIPETCIAPAGGTVDPVLTCSFSLAAGGSQAFTVAIQTAAVVGTQVNSVEVDTEEGVVDTNATNDSATFSTPVNNDFNSGAFVPSGGSLPFKGHLLTATDAANGVVAFMADALGGGSVCGATLCDNGLGVDFGTDPDRQGTVQVRIDFGRGNPCRGTGKGSSCWHLYTRKFGVVTLTPFCSTSPDAFACLISVDKKAPNITWLVRLRTTDPEFLPPLPSTSGSR